MNRVKGHLPFDPKATVQKFKWVKIIAIGPELSGKTSLVKHYCEREFSPKYQPTVGVDYGFKVHSVANNEYRVNIWDFSGSDVYESIRRELCDVDTEGCLLLFDVTDKQSFQQADKWYREMRRIGTFSFAKALVGNKADCTTTRQVTPAEASEWALRNQLRYFETSARSGDGVSEVFSWLLASGAG